MHVCIGAEINRCIETEIKYVSKYKVSYRVQFLSKYLGALFWLEHLPLQNAIVCNSVSVTGVKVRKRQQQFHSHSFW